MARRYWVVPGVLAALFAAFFGLVQQQGPENPSVQEYYSSIESRLGYWLLLGNARHCGLYSPDAIWPFPVSKALRKMEEKLYQRLGLQSGSRVLDAGSGSGIVAMYMARRGLLVDGIDITPVHLASARKNIKANSLDDKITIQLEDYHDLKSFHDNHFDGVYTMETFVHADDPLQVLKNFYRVLKPGGVLVLHEADFSRDSQVLQDVIRLSHCVNTLKRGAYEDLVREAGFIDFGLEDLTAEVYPFWRLLGVLAYAPYQVFKALGISHRFTNTMAAAEVWLNFDDGRYISIRAIKPPV